jgi:co-chaperonin GroES (HSP10)
MITPINRHLLIEPMTHESFIASDKETYEEIGTVLSVDSYLTISDSFPVGVGDRVYFDSWLAVKYPKKDGKDGEFYWLVKWDDIRAIEHAE